MSREPERQLQEEANADSELLSLPAELRNQIYTLALDIRPRSSVLPAGVLPPRSLLQTSRQLRQETQPIWYAQPILLTGWRMISRKGPPWFKALSTEAISCLRQLFFNFIVDYTCKHDGPSGAEIKIHYLLVNFDCEDGQVDYQLRCSDRRGVRDDGGDIAKECPVMERLQLKLLPVLDRMKGQQGRSSSQKEDLLALMSRITDFMKQGMV